MARAAVDPTASRVARARARPSSTPLDDRTVALEQYVAMATSSECEAIAVDLEIANRCDDTADGCAAGSPSLLAALVALG
jgi:hypothetical protein